MNRIKLQLLPNTFPNLVESESPMAEKSIAELYEDLTAALQALESAGEKPARSFVSSFGDGTTDSGLRGNTGCVRLVGGSEWQTDMGAWK